MYHDLDVRIPLEGRERAVGTLSRLGFDTAAFTTTVIGVRQLTSEHAPRHRLPIQAGDTGSTVTPEHHFCPSSRRKAKLRVLERITVVIEDAGQLAVMTSPILSLFDLVAVRPSTDKLLQQCLQFDFDILSIELHRKQQLNLKNPQFHVAAEKGIAVEVSYADALRGQGERRLLIGNACALARVSGGKHVILSSGAQHEMDLRGPHDVINLGLTFDLSFEQSRIAVMQRAAEAVYHGHVRARSHKGIVQVFPEGAHKASDFNQSADKTRKARTSKRSLDAPQQMTDE